MSALSPTLPPSATSAPYPSDPLQAGAYSSVLTHFSTGRNLRGAKLIPYGVRRVSARDRRRRLYHWLRSQGAVAFRSRSSLSQLIYLERLVLLIAGNEHPVT